jgi:hypothetical protein
MAALTTSRDTKRMGDAPISDIVSLPMAASTTCHQGGIVMVDTSGNANPGQTTTSMLAVGRCETPEGASSGQGGNNSSGAAGAIKIEARQGVFKWDNNGDITAAHIGTVCYVVDDHTVSHANSSQSRAGIVVQLDTDGVWVEMRLSLSRSSY